MNNSYLCIHSLTASPLTRCPMVIVCTTHSLIVLCAGEVKFYSPFLFFASPIVTLRTWRNDRSMCRGNDRSCMRCIWLYVFSLFFRFTSVSLYAFMYDAWNVLCIYIACGFCMFIPLIMHLSCVIFEQLFAISLVNLDFFTFVSYYLIARMSFHFFFAICFCNFMRLHALVPFLLLLGFGSTK